MATALQVNPSTISAQHQATIAASLARRLAVAKAAQNTQLLTLLEQEQQQLDRKSYPLNLAALVAQVKQVWHSWLNALDRHSQLSVKQVVGESGITFWHAYDPKTGKSLYAESSSEVVKWIEDNGLGQ